MIFILVAIVFVSGIVFLLGFGLNFKRAKRIQDEIIQSLPHSSSGKWFRIKIARPKYFFSKWKLLGFESRGLLVDAGERIRIIGQLASGEEIDLFYDKSTMNLRWLGNERLSGANMHWASIGDAAQMAMFSADTGMNAIASRQATADICRKIAPQLELPGGATSDFALEKNPASLAVLAIFFALLGYALVDGVFLNTNELIKIGNVVSGLFFIFALSIPCYGFLTQHQVPSRESLGLSLFLVAMASVAYFPAIMRVDQYLGGMQSVAYTKKTTIEFEPVTAGPPNLYFIGTKKYWAQFEKGSTHHFEMLHGPLGVWQLVHTNLDKEFQRYDDEHENDEKPGKAVGAKGG